MDITTRIIAEVKINSDLKTGLDRYAQVTSLHIDGANNGLITVKGRNVLVSATGVAMHIEKTWEFTRMDTPESSNQVKVVDTPAVYYLVGEEMGNGLFANGGELKTEETWHFETQILKAANLKYSMLEASPIGLGIKQMLIAHDLNGAIVNGEWVEANLKQM